MNMCVLIAFVVVAIDLVIHHYEKSFNLSYEVYNNKFGGLFLSTKIANDISKIGIVAVVLLQLFSANLRENDKFIVFITDIAILYIITEILWLIILIIHKKIHSKNAEGQSTVFM